MEDGPIIGWLKSRKRFFGQNRVCKYPADYILDLRDISKKLSDMVASLGKESATADERKHLQRAQSHVRSALELFEDAQRSSEAAW